jgi:hypothetical protein
MKISQNRPNNIFGQATTPTKCSITSAELYDTTHRMQNPHPIAPPATAAIESATVGDQKHEAEERYRGYPDICDSAMFF